MSNHTNACTLIGFHAHRLVVVDVRSVEEDLTLDDAALVVVAAPEVAKLMLEVPVPDALVTVESVALGVDVVEVGPPEVDEPAEPAGLAVAVAQYAERRDCTAATL